MREIKFRQPIFSRNGEFLYFHFWGFIGGNFVSPESNTSTIQGAKETSQRFTGLHDKNGKEIYEGDILREQQDDCDPETWLVEWYVNDIHCGWNTDPAMTWYSEVIGNIYDNPEQEN